MPENATDLLRKAIAEKVAERVAALRQSPAKAKGHSYSITCSGCNSVTQFTDEDLPNYRTDPSTGSDEGNDPDEQQDPDEESEEDQDTEDDDELTEEEREEYAKDPKSALAASLIKAAKLNTSN
jgi:hypothetical protein